MTTPHQRHPAAPTIRVPVQAVPVSGGPGPYLAAAQTRAATYSAATRHLCAGAYLDAEFRRISLREVYYQAKRMVAPSYGFDLGTVLLHCLRARNVAFLRDLALVAVLLIGLVAAPLAFLVALGLLWLASLGVEAYRVLRDAVRRVRADGQFDAMRTLTRLGMLLVRFLVGYAVLSIFSFMMIESFVSSGFRDDTWAEVQVVGTVMLLLFVYAVPLAANMFVQVQLGTLTPNGSFATAPRGERFDEIAYQQHGNQVVYSGYWPFVGSGDLVGHWSFAQRLMRPSSVFHEPVTEARREFASPPFTAQQLVDTIRESLRPFASEAEPERRLPALTVEDRVFVAGTEISHLVPHTPPDRMAQVVRYPTNPARHYLVCQVVSWDGELVTTVYVHVAVQGRMLFLELVSTGLPPCDERYRVVDQVGGTGPAAYGRAALDAILETPRTAAGALGNLVRTGLDVLAGTIAGAGSRADRAVTRGYDYGARVSVRDLGRSVEERHHLQAQDIDKYVQLIQRRVMATVLDFLDGQGVDTTEFSERAVNILNAGAIHTGTGNINLAGPGVGNQTNNHSGPARPGGKK